jgi:hypothetical protein
VHATQQSLTVLAAAAAAALDVQEVDAAALSSQLTRLAGRITTRLGQDEFGSSGGGSQPTSQQLLAEVLPMLWGMKAMLTEGKL